MNPKYRALLAAFLLPLLTGALLLHHAVPALAHPTTNCYLDAAQAGKRNVIGGDHGADTNQTGVKGSLLFGTFGDDCIRVTSLAVENGSGFVEIGWFMGWDTDNHNQFSGSGACQDDDYYTSPEVFEVWEPIGGGYHCRNLTFESEDSWHYVNIANPDVNTSWEFTEAGTTFDTRSVNFTRGSAITNGERHNGNFDIAKAHFKALQKEIAGNGNPWFDFSSSYGKRDNDNDYHWHLDTETETEVLKD